MGENLVVSGRGGKRLTAVALLIAAFVITAVFASLGAAVLLVPLAAIVVVVWAFVKPEIALFGFSNRGTRKVFGVIAVLTFPVPTFSAASENQRKALRAQATAIFVMGRTDPAKQQKALAEANSTLLDELNSLDSALVDKELKRRERVQRETVEKEKIEFAASAQKEQKNAERERILNATCSGDINCAASRFQAQAGHDCGPEIEKFAKYDFRWMGGWADPKLPNAKWSERYDVVEAFGEQRIIEFQGAEIQMQNGFGAYARVRYECDYDPVDRKVIAARVFN